MKLQIKLNDPDFKEKIEKSFLDDPGTYVLHWFEDNKPRKICRLLGTDHEGILYIGRTDKPLWDRVGESLRLSILANSDPSLVRPFLKGHQALSQKFYRVRKHINVNDLFVDITNEVKETPEKDESYFLEVYASKFGELPPFNGQFGSQEVWELYK